MSSTPLRRLIVAVVVAATAITAHPALAQTARPSSPPLRIDAPSLAEVVRPRPIADAAARLAAAAGAQQPAPATRPKDCVARVVIGTGVGAALGFGAAWALLASSGGSDSAGQIIKTFTLLGAGAGLLGGGIACTA